MKAKTAVVLLALVLIGVGFLTVRQSDWLESGDPNEPADETASIFEEDNLRAPQRVEVTSARGEDLVFQRQDDRWRMTQPIQAPAEVSKVYEIIELASPAEAQRAFMPDQPEGVPDSVTSLDKPLWTIRVTDDQGSRRTLRIGRKTPSLGTARQGTYVRPGDAEKTFVVTKDFARVLSRRPDEYRDLTMLDLQPSRIRTISVDGNQAYTVTRTDDGWGLTAPVAARANGDAIDDLAGRLARIKADRYVADGNSARTLRFYGLTEPQLRVAITVASEDPNAQPATHHLAIGGKSGDSIFARLEDQTAIYQLPASMLDKLQPPLDGIRGKTLLAFDPGDVTRIDITGREKALALQRDANGWTMTSPYTGPARNQAVSALLTKLENLQADRFRDNPGPLSALGLEPAERSIALYREGTDEVLTLEIGSRIEEKVFLRKAGSRAIAEVDRNTVDALLQEPANYWHTKVLTLDEGTEIIRIEQVYRGVKRVAARDANDWELVEPIPSPADVDGVEGILFQVRRLDGRKTTALGTIPDELRKSDTLVQLTLHTRTARDPNAPKTGTITIYAALQDDKTMLWQAGQQPLAVREFAAGLHMDLTAELRKRDIIDTRAEKIREIRTADPNGQTVTFTRTPSGWEASPKDAEFDSEQVDSLAGVLASLRPTRFALGKPGLAGRLAKDKPVRTLTIELEEDDKRTLTIYSTGPEDSDQRYATLSGVDAVLVLSAWQGEQLLTDFKQPEEMPQPLRGMPSGR